MSVGSSRRGGSAALLAILVLGAAPPLLAQTSRDEAIFGPTPAEPPPAAPGSPSTPAAAEGAAAPGAEGAPGDAGAGAAEAASPEPAAAPNPEQRPPAEATPATPASPAEPVGAASRDDAMLGDPSAETFLESEDALEDPLAIGGLLYLRAQSSALQGQAPDDWSFNAPSLLDVYLDARPNPRVRGFVLGRMLYDPTLPEAGSAAVDTSRAAEPGGATTGTQELSQLFQAQSRGPRALLDQMWLRFDVARTVYVTAGKQHVRWGTARFWMPTDFLHVRRRNPLDVFDARTGTTMLKLHLPIESRAWNFYAFAVFEDADATPTVGKIAGAARAEFVLDAVEMGLGVFARRGSTPRLAADISAGIWDFDVYGEVAVRDGGEVDRVRFAPNAELPEPPVPQPWQRPEEVADAGLRGVIDALYPVYRNDRLRAQAVGGLTYSHQYNDNDVLTVGAEYFYNQLGYSSPTAYPGLVLPHSRPLSEPATFFYLGQHYGALFATFPAPFSLDRHTFTLSTLGNLSDQSFISRLDYSLVVLTHMTFESFVAVHYGRTEGEFRFGVEGLDLGPLTFERAPALLDLGVALRVAI